MKRTLHKLLGKDQSHLLVAYITHLIAGEEHSPPLAGLVEVDGHYLAGNSSWPQEMLQQALAKARRSRETIEHQAKPGMYQFLFPLYVGRECVGALVTSGPTLPAVRKALETLSRLVEIVLSLANEKRALAQETLERYREINLLYNIGETIGACLDPEEIPHLVLEEAGRVIRADTGAVLLPDEQGTLVMRSSFGEEGHPAALYATTGPFLARALQEGQPCIFTSEQLISQSKPVASALCAPLKNQGRILGVTLLGRLLGKPVFTAGEEKLLMALTGQAAIAMENARLFDDIKRQRDAIAAMKNHMDNIFASIASGVITTDIKDMITTLNRAAEIILGVHAKDTMGQPYIRALPTIGTQIAPLVENVKQSDQSIKGHELNPVLPNRGQIVLRLHLSPLKDNQNNTTGIAIVADDLTEHRQLEEQVRQIRETFEQYVVPRVVEQLLSDPASVQLGGTRQEISTLYADIRNFTSFSERSEPEVLVEVLNRHLTLAVEAILTEEGTLDKFVGDAVMAIFNAPLPQPNHALRAVRAALAMQRAIAELHTKTRTAERLSFGIGIATGPAVVGNIGSTTIHDYTAIGGSVNLAWRLQAQAKPGQILLDAIAYEHVRDHIQVSELGYIQVKGHSEPVRAYEVLALKKELTGS
jgi:PAS domain S-box-containing protein